MLLTRIFIALIMGGSIGAGAGFLTKGLMIDSNPKTSPNQFLEDQQGRREYFDSLREELYSKQDRIQSLSYGVGLLAGGIAFLFSFLKARSWIEGAIQKPSSH